MEPSPLASELTALVSAATKSARIADLERALRPFADAYRHAASMPEWLREDMLASMTVCGITTEDFMRAAEIVTAEQN